MCLLNESQSDNPTHLANLLGVFASAVADDLAIGLRQRLGVGGSGTAALLAIDSWPIDSIGFLADVLEMSHSGTVRLVERLKREGLVEELPSGDGRTVSVMLTRVGEDRVLLARRWRDSRLTEVVEQMTELEGNILNTALMRYMSSKPRTRTEARHVCRFCDHSVCRGASCPVGISADG